MSKFSIRTSVSSKNAIDLKLQVGIIDHNYTLGKIALDKGREDPVRPR